MAVARNASQLVKTGDIEPCFRATLDAFDRRIDVQQRPPEARREGSRPNVVQSIARTILEIFLHYLADDGRIDRGLLTFSVLLNVSAISEDIAPATGLFP
ncbi:hypothetical protein ACQZ5G_11705 [Agrobacterium sp. 22-214-1]